MTSRLDLELLLRRYGWRKAMTIVLILAAGIALTMTLMPQPAAPVLVEASDGSRQLEANHRAFRALLIPRGEIETRQGEVLELLVRHGLAVGHIDYGQESREAGRFAVTSLQLPLRGRYEDLRAFLADALVAQPALAIEDLAIQRDADGQGVAARLKLAFLTEPAGEPRR